MFKVLITTVPFGAEITIPLDLLKEAGVSFFINPTGRKLEEEELVELVNDFDVIIAGTEPITDKVMSRAPNLKLISRVGIGLDSVDLVSAKRRGIRVSYTPDAPAPAVADFTIGLMYSLSRFIHVANSQVHRGDWRRHFGRRIEELTIGVIGAGRIGSRVIQDVTGLGNTRILVNDIDAQRVAALKQNVVRAEKGDLFRHADVISLHVPLTAQTKNMIKREHLMQMKPNALIINTSRGGIINERDLAAVLNAGHLGGAAIDVFEQEPYKGELANVERCLLTSHMGSMSIDCRSRMEIEATEEALRFFRGEPLKSLVPPQEYEVQMQEL